MISDELNGRVWLGDDLAGSAAPPEEAAPGEAWSHVEVPDRPRVPEGLLLEGLEGPSPRVWEEIEARLRGEGRIR